jgi:hypothetical protein
MKCCDGSDGNRKKLAVLASWTSRQFWTLKSTF